MTSIEDNLKGRLVLVVDDEPDILDMVEEQLYMCILHKAASHDKAMQFLLGYTYDIVILDIMGVDGFNLLKHSTRLNFPTVMLTAHALSPEAMKKSIKLGAVSFLPKEELANLPAYLCCVLQGGGKLAWRNLFEKLGSFFSERFGSDWKDSDVFFKEFEAALKEGQEEHSSGR